METRERKDYYGHGKEERHRRHEGRGRHEEQGRHESRDRHGEQGRHEGRDRHEGWSRHEKQGRREEQGRYEGRNRHEEQGRHGEQGGQREHRGGRPERKGYRALVEKPGTHLLFIGSRSCTRHKGTVKLELQREGKLTFLSLEEVDWITGGYLEHIEEAVREIAGEVHPQRLVLFGGCQIELLSTDYDTLTKNLSRELGIEARFHKGCHLVGYDPDAEE